MHALRPEQHRQIRNPHSDLRNALPVPEMQYLDVSGETYNYFDTFELNPPAAAATATIDLLFQPTSYEYQLFQPKANRGDNVVIRGNVADGNGVPLAGAVMIVDITGPDPDTVTAAQLTSSPSDTDGFADSSWQTAGPQRRQPPTAPGVYTATVAGVTATGYLWDGVAMAVTFEIQ